MKVATFRAAGQVTTVAIARLEPLPAHPIRETSVKERSCLV
jgi:hypothetical protein